LDCVYVTNSNLISGGLCSKGSLIEVMWGSRRMVQNGW
jgi:hypothetical protein